MNLFLPDLNPLIEQIKQFNLNQARTNQLLEEIKELFKNYAPNSEPKTK